MHWHAELTMSLDLLVAPGKWLRTRRYTLRGYSVPDGFANHLDFDAIAQAQIDVDERMAFVSGAHGADGRALRTTDWRGLGRLLRDDLGIDVVRADRDGKDVTFQLRRSFRG